MLTAHCQFQTSELFVSDTMDDILSDNCELVAESDGRGTNYLQVSPSSQELSEYLSTDITKDDIFHINEYEGKFLKIIYTSHGSGTVDFEEGDEIDIDTPLLFEYGMFNGVYLKGGDYVEIIPDTEYDTPVIETVYYLIKEGRAHELNEEDGELYYFDSDEKIED